MAGQTSVKNMASQRPAPVDSITRVLPGELVTAIFDYHVPHANAILLPQPYYPQDPPGTTRALRPSTYAASQQVHFTCALLQSNDKSRADLSSAFQRQVHDLNIASMHATVTNFDFDPLVDFFMYPLTCTGKFRSRNFPISVTLIVNEDCVEWSEKAADTNLVRWLNYVQHHRYKQEFVVTYDELIVPTGLQIYQGDLLAGFISGLVQTMYKAQQIPDLQRITDLVRKWYQNREEVALPVHQGRRDVEMCNAVHEEDEGDLNWEDRQHFNDGESEVVMNSECEEDDKSGDEGVGEFKEFVDMDIEEESDYNEEEDPEYREVTDDGVVEEDEEDPYSHLNSAAREAIRRGYDPTIFGPDYNDGEFGIVIG